MRILLVEDNAGDVSLFDQALRDAQQESSLGPSCTLLHAKTLEGAIDHLSEGGIDVIVCDLSLPDSQDVATVKALRSESPDVPLVVLTGSSDESLALEAVKAGAQDYLIKGQVSGPWLVRSLRYAVERQRMQAAVRSLALLDELTGLYNRRGFMTIGGQQLEAAFRTRKGAMIGYVDLDNMKQINDRFGHKEGDQALIHVAEVLRRSFRLSDVIARIGGDEFTVLASNAGPTAGTVIVRRLDENLRELGAREALPYRLSVTVGLVHFDPDVDRPSLPELIARADAALYDKKRKKLEAAEG